jgi:2-dehydro-3-deoxy-D-arabinonate dehydratase
MLLANVLMGYTRLPARIEGEDVHVLDTHLSLSAILHSNDPPPTKVKITLPLSRVTLLPPIDRQEVWAAGVTYVRSKAAREEESAASGASRFYDKVYTAERPELFFKAPSWRVVAPGQPVRIRKDARWSVPEPELTVLLSPRLEVVGFTIGNDMSSRDIEGENPLYLPQAKCYDGSCALGPFVRTAASMPGLSSVTIHLEVYRQEELAFEGSTSASQLKRSFAELAGWLGREMSFPDGVALMTGTGIVPPASFTLQSGDVVRITVPQIGALVNAVE